MSYPIAVQSKLLELLRLREEKEAKQAVYNVAEKQLNEICDRVRAVEDQLIDWAREKHPVDSGSGAPQRLLEVDGKLFLIQPGHAPSRVIEIVKETPERVLR